MRQIVMGLNLFLLLMGQAQGADGEGLTRKKCGTCHSFDARQSMDLMAFWSSKGPTLAYAGSKFQLTWLEQWLVSPTRIRAAGYQSYQYAVPTADGDKTDTASIPEHIKVSKEDATVIAGYLATLRKETNPFPQHHAAAAMPGVVHFQNVLGCGGCHQTKQGEEARSGPELFTAGRRLSLGWMMAFVSDPGYWAAVPMPRPRIRSDQLKAVADYIVSLDGQIAPPARSDATEISYSQITANTAEPAPRERAAIIYRMVCSQCHGITGNGKGINAPYLSEQPRNHRNTDEMRKLSDDHLFQVIKFGGPAVDRSSLMPSWGGTLGDDDIKGLITYLRTISGTTNATNAPKRDNP